MNNTLKIFALIIGALLLFTITHSVSHKIAMKPHAKMEGKHFNVPRRGGPKALNKGAVHDKNRNIVRHGFLQHHIHDGSGNVLWQKPSDPELVIREEEEYEDLESHHEPGDR